MIKNLATALVVFISCLLLLALIVQEQRVETRLIGVTAECNNGRFTTSERGRGVCSGNGGVKRWIE